MNYHIFIKLYLNVLKVVDDEDLTENTNNKYINITDLKYFVLNLSKILWDIISNTNKWIE